MSRRAFAFSPFLRAGAMRLDSNAPRTTTASPIASASLSCSKPSHTTTIVVADLGISCVCMPRVSSVASPNDCQETDRLLLSTVGKDLDCTSRDCSRDVVDQSNHQAPPEPVSYLSIDNMMKDEEVGEEEIISLMSAEAGPAAAAPAMNGSHHPPGPSPSARPPRRRPMDQIRMNRGDESLQSPFMLRLTCLSVLTLVVLGSMGLLTYVQDEKSQIYEFIPAPVGGEGAMDPMEDDSFSSGSTPTGAAAAAAASQWSGLLDKEALKKVMDDAGVVESTRASQKVHYNPQFTQYNPFDFQEASSPYPVFPLLGGLNNIQGTSTPALGYVTMPHMVKNQLVFCSQGDVFITAVQPQKWKEQATTGSATNWGPYPSPLTATKLTTTVGNVLDPKLHPNLRYLAYTATYSNRRDLYLLDLQGGSPAVRLTYWDSSVGINGLIGWWGESALVFRAHSNEIGLPDYRLYVLHLQDKQDGTLVPPNHANRHIRRLEDVEEFGEENQGAETPPAGEDSGTVASSQRPRAISMLKIDPIPLSQARDAARSGDCWYFVRYAQSSNTIRYVGGTAEQLYRYCDGSPHADRLLHQDKYKGTSKSPQMYPESQYLFFLSDRGRRPDGSWHPDRMNVWALALSDDLHDHTGDRLIQITDTTCDFDGRVIQEYSIDIKTGHMVLRIGADLYWMTAAAIQAKLSHGASRRSRLDEETIGQASGFGNATMTDEPDEDGENELDPVDAGNETDAIENVTKVYYNYETPALTSRFAEDIRDHVTGSSSELTRLPIVVYSDFHTHHERLIPFEFPDHLTSADVYETALGSLQFVSTIRGQLWVAPVMEDIRDSYGGSGRNMPERRYRLAPGATMGGVVRILTVRHVPNPVEDDSSDRRLAVILATDPLTRTAEHAFYLIETQSGATPLFMDLDHLPKPFLGGQVSGGSTKDGGLGSVKEESVRVSPCGRRMAWTDTDGRIVVMNLPHYQDISDGEVPLTVVLPKENERGEPMVGDAADFSFSPGGRYLAIEHSARNQFSVISIVDLGDPQGEDKVADIQVGRIVQATPDRFNSNGAFWGKSTADMHAYDREKSIASLLGSDPPEDSSTTLYFLSDQDLRTDVKSPWGTRQPMPHFKKQKSVYALPLQAVDPASKVEGPFSGGGASELKVGATLARRKSVKALLSATSHQRRLSLERSLGGAFWLADDAYSGHGSSRARRGLDETTPDGHDEGSSSQTNDDNLRAATFPRDVDIDFGPVNDLKFTFARRAYRLATIPEAEYTDIVSQTVDDGSFVLVARENDKAILKVYFADDFPSDQYLAKSFSPVGRELSIYGRSTCGNYLYFGFDPDGQLRMVANSGTSVSKMLLDVELDDNIVSLDGLHLSVWPGMEYRQLYDDAWRMLRDYFYDPEMTGIDWTAVHERFLPLVSRAAKREELDDVLVQMASELSALHVFVYGGEYDSPSHGNSAWSNANAVASLGATFKRVPEWKGYQIVAIPEIDPDFSIVDGGKEIYSPLSNKTLRMSGQKGLEAGDVIVGINGESVMSVPDMHMLLRGMAGQSVRLDVLRLASGNQSASETNVDATIEPVIVVPIKTSDADGLRYNAWEWKTRQLAEKLARENGFTVGYVHLRDMSGPEAEDAFARGFFPDYNKDAMILDVRSNSGGNIDSWVLDVLQRKAWMYWQSRDFNVQNGGQGWDEHFAFRGHLVVLINEKTSSDGEGVSRGISELGLGRLIGTRTWGGGIWLASDNHLVDGGIATAPEIGTYNENFGWGLGIEQMGVDPDIEVDNDPHQAYTGMDTQLEAAISELRKWLDSEPIVLPKPPEKKRDMTLGERECKRSN